MILIKSLIIIILINYSIQQQQQPQQKVQQQQQRSQHFINLINTYYLNLINLIEPKLRIYLRELKDNSLLLLLFVEPKIKEIEIIEYQVNYINKINNKELMKIELNNDLNKRLLVELKDLYQNTPYKICIQAKLQFTCGNVLFENHINNNGNGSAEISNEDYEEEDESDGNDVESNDLNQNNFDYVLHQYCNTIQSLVNRTHTNNTTASRIISEIANKQIIINNCIDNIITQKSISLQALGSSLGAILSLLIIMSCIYLIQSCKPGRAFQKLRCRKPFVNQEV